MAVAAATHVLVFPYPAQGHMLPLLDLTHELSGRGLSVTVLVTPKNLPLLSPLLRRCPSIATLVLPFPSDPSIPAGVENVKDLRPSYFFEMMNTLGSLHRPILDWARTSQHPPHAIISDFFLGWTQRLAEELGIPRLCFSPSAAYALASLHFLWRNSPKRDDPEDENFPVCFRDVPNSPTFPWWQIFLSYRRYRVGDPTSEFVRGGFLANLDSWGFVVNSFEELDGMYLRDDLGHRRVWAVGPLKGDGRGGGSSPEVERFMAWLDTCPEGSVVYICFGTQAVLGKGQLEAIAGALEESGVRFVWVVKKARDDGENGGEVPEGFEERTEGKGVVVKCWAPQAEILRHRAVGSFLSHCGWNSVLEAVAAGVVVMAWPMGADQYLNTRLLVEEAGMAVRVIEGPNAVPEVGKLATALREAVGGMREKAVEMGRMARAAVAAGGNSTLQLEGLVAKIRKLGAPVESSDDEAVAMENGLSELEFPLTASPSPPPSPPPPPLGNGDLKEMEESSSASTNS